jgi:hypothetical protein
VAVTESARAGVRLAASKPAASSNARVIMFGVLLDP